MNTKEVITLGSEFLSSLSGHVFDLLTVTKPVSPNAALNLARIIHKLSPLVGNLIEFNVVEFLNAKREFEGWGRWVRQDPGFPDTIFEGRVRPTPGFEIKAWFPLATEITGRFRDSQNHFVDDRTYVCLVAWLPDKLIYGKPYILDVVVVPGLSVAKARDDHYHNPPDYIVLEPEDTTSRTPNLQQTNTAGYKFQSGPENFREAQKIVASWGPTGKEYRPTREYQMKLRELTSRYTYRLDTNYAKMDRIVHDGIEAFKARVCGTAVNGMTVRDWTHLFASDDEVRIRSALKDNLAIKEGAAERLRG